MKILITGITGLLGSYLAKEFASHGEIHGIRRPGSSTRLLEDVDFPIHWHEGELSDVDSLESAVSGKDLVIHVAGKVSYDPADTDQLYETNVRGTANLVNAMLQTEVRKLVHVSSVAAIGRAPEQLDYDEDYKWTESPFNTDYAISKYWGELEAWRGEQEGLDLMVVNPSVLLGKISDDRSSTAIYHYVLEENSFYPSGNVNYLDVRDAAEMVRLLVEKEAWGKRFILNKESMSYKEFFQKMAEAFGKKAPNRPTNSMMLQLAVLYASISRKLGLSKNPLNKKTAMLSSQKVAYDNTKATSLLDFKYRDLKDTFLWAK